jgi:hypothetical protein
LEGSDDKHHWDVKDTGQLICSVVGIYGAWFEAPSNSGKGETLSRRSTPSCPGSTPAVHAADIEGIGNSMRDKKSEALASPATASPQRLAT